MSDYYKFKTCCKINSKSDSYGPAIEDVSICEYVPKWAENEDIKIGEMWAGNGEYSSQINYCPFCGKKAEVQIK